ncbi:MAG: hypothetical protein LBG81_07050 [Coriobacteriaceae bacterium]|jgi:16S rRNA processing protein RimM|nr:hypothetical protein [Coriobacteriaceae bacterium]
MRRWAKVAVVTKAKYSQGGLAVRAVAGLPFLLRAGMQIAFVPPQLDAPRRAQVCSVRHVKDAVYLTEFDPPLSPDAAGILEGCYCLAERRLLPSDAVLPLERGCEGFEVVDSSFGSLGRVTGLNESPAQACLIVEGHFGSLMIPFVDEFVKGVDCGEGIVETSIPQGLLDLATSTKDGRQC